MIPTNTQMTPEIKNIADNNGDKHTVIPTPHTHSKDEVAGLENFINTHSHMINKHNVDAYAYVDVQADTDNGKAKIELGIEDTSELEFLRKIAITWENIKNFARALLDPDTTPTANSDKLVTSGGVKAALDNKTSISHEDMDSIIEVEVKHVGDDEYDQAKVIGRNRIVIGVGADSEDGSAIINANNIANLQRAIQDPDSTPIANSTNLVTSGGVKAALDGKPSVYDTEVVFMEEEETPFIYLPEYFTHGEKQKTFIMDYQGASTPFADIFHAQNTDIIRILSHDDEIINIAECFLSFRVIRHANGIAQGSDAYYVIFDGKNEY